MKYLESPGCPGPLYDALVDSSREYAEESREFLQRYRFDHQSSATALIHPTQRNVLFGRYARDIWVDPLEFWRSMMGNIVHFVLEKYAAKNPIYQTEVRLGAIFNVDGQQVLVHGKFDLYNTETCGIQDWKFTKASSMGYPKTAYEMQLNVLYYLALKNGYRIDSLENIYLFSELDPRLMGLPDYPDKPYKVISVKMMPLNEIHNYIVDRIRRQLTEKDKPDRELTPCTDEEMWVRNSEWALYLRKKSGKPGADGLMPFSSRAAFRGPGKESLKEHRISLGVVKSDTLYKEFKGSPRACEYCNARTVCRQYQNRIREIEQQQNEQLRELK